MQRQQFSQKQGRCLLDERVCPDPLSHLASVVAVYAPIKRFVDDALVVMRSAALNPADMGDGAPGSDRPPGRSGAPSAWLHASLEAYVADTFLPQVFQEASRDVTPDLLRMVEQLLDSASSRAWTAEYCLRSCHPTRCG